MPDPGTGMAGLDCDLDTCLLTLQATVRDVSGLCGSWVRPCVIQAPLHQSSHLSRGSVSK